MNIKETWSNLMYGLEEQSPKIKIFVGVAGLVTAGVLACKATLKLREKTESERKAFKDIHKIKAAKDRKKLGINDTIVVNKSEGETEEVDNVPVDERISEDIQNAYSDKDYAKDVIKTSLSYGKKIFMLYGLPVCIAVVSAGLIFNGTKVLNARNLAMSAAYASLDAAFKNYQGRVKERFGEEVENEIRYGLEPAKIKEKVKDEDGNEKVVTKKVEVAKQDPTSCSPYAFIFDSRFGEYVDDIDMCETFLRGVQHEMNAKFTYKKKKYQVLNGLYDKLGAPEEFYTAASMRVGWLRKSEDGDGCVNLRIQRIFIPDTDGKRMVPAILVDPNVEGDIYSKISKTMGYAV